MCVCVSLTECCGRHLHDDDDGGGGGGGGGGVCVCVCLTECCGRHLHDGAVVQSGVQRHQRRGGSGGALLGHIQLAAGSYNTHTQTQSIPQA